jgi:hypothetical protein
VGKLPPATLTREPSMNSIRLRRPATTSLAVLIYPSKRQRARTPPRRMLIRIAVTRVLLIARGLYFLEPISADKSDSRTWTRLVLHFSENGVNQELSAGPAAEQFW